MQDKNVFIFWVGKDYSLIKILRELIYLHSDNGKNYKIHFLNDDNVEDYIENISPKYYKLRPAHKADFVRVNVICDYGGIWLDSDTLVMNDLSSLFKILEEKDGFFVKENNKDIVNGVFGSKKNTPLMEKWKDIINNNLKLTSIKELYLQTNWVIFGSRILKEFYDNNKQLYNNYLIYDGLDNLYPIYWKDCVNEFIKKPYNNYKKIIRKFQPVVVLVNSVYKELEKLSIKEIKGKKMPINYFINKSYENNKNLSE
jgi:hypothetical protein